MLTTKSVIQASGVAFGTSGARGLVTDFTEQVCAAFTLAFTGVLSRQNPVKRLAIGIDNRPSSPAMALACAKAARALGIETEYFGVLPTPALAFYSMQQQIPAIMVTGSHIPFDRNGLKFYRADGEIDKADELAINEAEEPLVELAKDVELTVSPAAVEAYKQRYLRLFDEKPLRGKRLGIYEHSSAGRDIYQDVFSALGAEVISLGRSDEFVPIDTEAVSQEDKDRALAWQQEYQLDAIFSTDGDGDRPLVANESGQWLTGDELCLLCAKALNIDALAVPVSCNTAIEKSESFQQVNRTRIGSPYVIAEFDSLCQHYTSVAGFEANGGFLLASTVSYNQSDIAPLPTRDALLPALIVLAQGNVELQQQSLPVRYTASDRLKAFPRETSLALIDRAKVDLSSFLGELGISQGVQKVDETDGLRVTLDKGDIVHLRPSGNAPELRCYSESDEKAKAVDLVEQVLSRLKAMA